MGTNLHLMGALIYLVVLQADKLDHLSSMALTKNGETVISAVYGKKKIKVFLVHGPYKIITLPHGTINLSPVPHGPINTKNVALHGVSLRT